MEYLWGILLILVVLVFFLINIWVLWRDRNRYQQKRKELERDLDLHLSIHTASLLNERMEVLKEWDIRGKTGILIGRIDGETSDEIDLSDTADAALISKEHAVLNYANGIWYVEDLDSKNGTGIRKAGSSEILWLTDPIPYRLEAGDILYIAESPILMK